MCPFAVDILEFSAVRGRIAAAAATDYGEELARTLAPSPDLDEVARRQALTAEAIGLLEASEEPPLDGIRDVREAAALAARGGVLPAAPLRHIGDTVTGSLRVRGALETPLLAALAETIDPALKPLADAIDRAIEDDGSDLKDNATPAPRKLRGELRTGRRRVTEKLKHLRVRPADASRRGRDDLAAAPDDPPPLPALRQGG